METRGRQTASFHSLARRAWTPQYYPAAAGRLGDRANGRAARRGESVVRVGGLASESRQRLGVASSACKSLRLTRGSAATGMHRRSSRAPRRYGKPSCRTNGRRGGAVRSGAAMPSAAAMALAATARGPNRLGRRSPGGLGESEEQPEPVGRRWAGAAAAAAKSRGSESGSLWPIGGRPDGPVRIMQSEGLEPLVRPGLSSSRDSDAHRYSTSGLGHRAWCRPAAACAMPPPTGAKPAAGGAVDSRCPCAAPRARRGGGAEASP